MSGGGLPVARGPLVRRRGAPVVTRVDWRRLLRAADGPARLVVLMAVVLAFLRIFLD